MILYSIRRGPKGHQITKFDDDFNPAATYDVSVGACSCPAGPRPTCRHRKMLSRMLAKVDTDEFYCYETQTWHRPLSAEGGNVDSPTTEAEREVDNFTRQAVEQLAATLEPPIEPTDPLLVVELSAIEPPKPSAQPPTIRRR
jgi:hypothetical protein